MGAVTFGAVPQWNREGGTLFFMPGWKNAAFDATERETAFQSESFPNNARVSSLGDRVAFVDEAGLWVTQGQRVRIVANENGVWVLPSLVWSNDGDKLAYIVTHEGFDPHFGCSTPRATRRHLPQMEMDWNILGMWRGRLRMHF